MKLFVISYARWISQLSILVVVGCAVYVAFFLMTEFSIPIVGEFKRAHTAELSAIGLDAILKEPQSMIVAHNIFSARAKVIVPEQVVKEQAASRQLPANLKVVGVVIAQPTQVIIEDGNTKQTYFITEGEQQAGITVKRVAVDQIMLNYLGQDIAVPLRGDAKIPTGGSVAIP